MLQGWVFFPSKNWYPDFKRTFNYPLNESYCQWPQILNALYIISSIITLSIELRKCRLSGNKRERWETSCPTFGEQFLDFIHKSCIFPSSPNSKRSYYWIELRKCGLSGIGQPFDIFTSQSHFQFLILPPHFHIPLS